MSHKLPYYRVNLIPPTLSMYLIPPTLSMYLIPPTLSMYLIPPTLSMYLTFKNFLFIFSALVEWFQNRSLSRETIACNLNYHN